MPVIDEIHFIFYDRPPTEQLKTDLNQDREALRLSRPVSDNIVTSSVRHKGSPSWKCDPGLIARSIKCHVIIQSQSRRNARNSENSAAHYFRRHNPNFKNFVLSIALL